MRIPFTLGSLLSSVSTSKRGGTGKRPRKPNAKQEYVCMTFVLRCQATNLAAEATDIKLFQQPCYWSGYILERVSQKGGTAQINLPATSQGSILDAVQELRGAKLPNLNILPCAVTYSWKYMCISLHRRQRWHIFFTSLVPAIGYPMGRISSWNSLLSFGCSFWRI